MSFRVITFFHLNWLEEIHVLCLHMCSGQHAANLLSTDCIKDMMVYLNAMRTHKNVF